MFDFETNIAGIEYKVRRLIQERDDLRNAEDKLKALCEELQQQINDQQNTINNLKEENKILKLGNALIQKGDSTEIKLKINQLIRNIDKSLSLLNKAE